MKLMLDTKLQSEEFKFYFLFFLALTFLFAMLMPFSYGDLAIWIAEGRQIFEQGTVYIRDVYSFNPTQTLPYPWLSCIFYYLIDSNFAIESIFFIHRVIPVAIVGFWLVRYPALMHKNSIVSLMICISGIRMLIIDRPALLVLPLIPYFYELIESERIYRKKLKTILLLILWTNLHGSFMLFFLLMGYKVAIDLLKKRRDSITVEKLLFFVGTFLATCINPWGIKIYYYVFQTAAVSKLRITEWQPLALFDNGEISFEFVFFVATVVLLLAITFYKKKLSQLLTSILPVFLISSVLAVRNLPLLFSVIPLFWGKYLVDTVSLSGFAKRAGLTKIIFNRAIIVFMLASGVFMFTDMSENVRTKLSKKYAHKYDETSSFRIAEYLNRSSGKRVFNSWILGSFLLYSQSNQIFIDTRNIIYDNEIYTDYVNTVKNHNGLAESLLNQYQIDYVVSEKKDTISSVLSASAAWNFIMEDNGYFLFERR